MILYAKFYQDAVDVIHAEDNSNNVSYCMILPFSFVSDLH